VEPSKFPFITVCMPVRNEERFIAGTINELLQQNYPGHLYEIIVADGDSTDRTKNIVLEIAKEHPQVKLLPNPGKLPSSGRNVGFKNGKGEVFLVVDGHCKIPSTTLLKDIADCFAKSGAQVLGRPQPLDPPDLTVFQQAVALARSSKIGHGADSLIYSDYEGFVSPVSHGAVYKKEIFEKVGYVDENFDACEDVEFNYRVEQAGFTCFMSPKLAVKYYPRESLKGLFLQMSRYGKGRFKLVKKHFACLTIPLLVPPLFVLSLFVFAALAFFSWFFAYTFGLITAAYLALIIGVAISIAKKDGRQYLFFLVPIFVAIHIGLGWGFLKQLIFHK
jgi:succinoglycan biosynthesis protein ExoA